MHPATAIGQWSSCTSAAGLRPSQTEPEEKRDCHHLQRRDLAVRPARRHDQILPASSSRLPMFVLISPVVFAHAVLNITRGGGYDLRTVCSNAMKRTGGRRHGQKESPAESSSQNASAARPRSFQAGSAQQPRVFRPDNDVPLQLSQPSLNCVFGLQDPSARLAGVNYAASVCSQAVLNARNAYNASSKAFGQGFLTGKIDASTKCESTDFRAAFPRFTEEARKANQAPETPGAKYQAAISALWTLIRERCRQI